MLLFAVRHPYRPRRTLLGVALFAGFLAGGAFAVDTAHAAVACRSDPVVTLSNGIKMNLTATLANDTPGDINGITYTLHAPQGTSVTQVVYTGGAVGQRERLVFYADNSPHDYDVTTYVDTNSTGVSVTATATTVYQGAGSGGNIWNSATGHDHQDIAVQVTQ